METGRFALLIRKWILRIAFDELSLKDRKSGQATFGTASLRLETAKFQKEILRLRLNIKRKVGVLPRGKQGGILRMAFFMDKADGAISTLSFALTYSVLPF